MFKKILRKLLKGRYKKEVIKKKKGIALIKQKCKRVINSIAEKVVKKTK